MRRYVFEEYRNSIGAGSEEVYDQKDEALKFAEEHWNHLSESDKDSYRKDRCGIFLVYEIDIPAEELSEPLSEYATEYIKDWLE